MKTIPLTQGFVALVDDVDYEAVSKFKWCAHRENRNVYAIRNLPDGRQERMHRAIAGTADARIVHHKNGDGLDNRRINLEAGTQKENMRGLQKKHARATSRFRGVYWNTNKKKWTAQIKKDGNGRYLGLFESEEYAARAYDAAARELFGAGASPNFS